MEAWTSPLLDDSGDTFERTFAVEATYDFLCEPHKEVGMIGSVVVGGPYPYGQPGREPPAGEYSETVSGQFEWYNEKAPDVLHRHGARRQRPPRREVHS